MTVQEPHQRGFTLVELLIALLVFSFVAAAGVYSLRLGVEARDQLGAADARLSELELARILIREDMLQVAPRAVRDEFGSVFGPPFQGGQRLARTNMPADGERLLLAFVRRGWINPESAAPRSSLQYVEYVEKDGALVRRIRPYLDDARGQPVYDRILIADAANIGVEFHAGEARGELDWTNEWPMPGRGVEPPLAMSLTYSTDRYGELTQRFWIGRAFAERS